MQGFQGFVELELRKFREDMGMSLLWSDEWQALWEQCFSNYLQSEPMSLSFDWVHLGCVNDGILTTSTTAC